jgi:hypothetical protein
MPLAYARPMTREESEQRAAELNRSHPDRATHHWMARETASGYEIVRVALPPGMRREPPRKADVEARPRPPMADDVRPVAFRDIGGPYAF